MQKISEIIEKVIEEMCDKYCKYPDEYLSKLKDPDIANDQMLENVCAHCPLSKL